MNDPRIILRDGVSLAFVFVVGFVFFVSAEAQEIEKIRDPFWPVGYVPPTWVAPAVQPSTEPSAEQAAEIRQPVEMNVGWDEALALVRVEGVSSKGDLKLIIINGHVKKIGETLSVRHGESRYTWLIEALDAKGSLKLKRISVQ